MGLGKDSSQRLDEISRVRWDECDRRAGGLSDATAGAVTLDGFHLVEAGAPNAWVLVLADVGRRRKPS